MDYNNKPLQNKSISENQVEISEKIDQIGAMMEAAFGDFEEDIFDSPLISIPVAGGLPLNISIRQGLQLILAATLGMGIGDIVGAIGSLVSDMPTNKDLADKIDEILGRRRFVQL
jgi:hypothetical protein